MIERGRQADKLCDILEREHDVIPTRTMIGDVEHLFFEADVDVIMQLRRAKLITALAVEASLEGWDPPDTDPDPSFFGPPTVRD